MGQKDLTEKGLESYPDVFADIVNALLHWGERVLSPEGLQPAPTETLYKDRQGLLHNQFHDVSKYEMDAGRIRAQYTLENETVPNRRTVLRKAGYEGGVYRDQYDKDELYPFVSMVLYWGRSRWRAPRSIHKLFAGKQFCKEYVDNIRLHVYEMAHLPKEVRERFHSDMRIVVDYLAEGKDYVPTEQKIIHLEALLMMLSALTGDVRYEEIVPELQDEEKEKGGIGMCELLDKYENRGMERGLAQGMERGLAQGMAQGMERGLAQGMAQGIECVNELIKRLIGDGRSDEIARMVSDAEYQKQLLAEYGL